MFRRYAYPGIAFFTLATIPLILLSIVWNEIRQHWGNADPAWFQAIFSVIAIVAAIFIAYWQAIQSRKMTKHAFEEQRRVAAENESALKSLRYKGLQAILEAMKSQLEHDLNEWVQHWKVCFFIAKFADYGYMQGRLHAFPMNEIPDAYLIKYIMDFEITMKDLQSEIDPFRTTQTPITMNGMIKTFSPALIEKLFKYALDDCNNALKHIKTKI